MEVRILEVRLAGGTKAVWRFSGEPACCCLELIEKVVIPEMLPGMLRRCRSDALRGLRTFRPDGGGRS